MSALTVTLGADITALKRAMAGATEFVNASARRMGKMTSAGLVGLGKGARHSWMWKSAEQGNIFPTRIGAAGFLPPPLPNGDANVINSPG